MDNPTAVGKSTIWSVLTRRNSAAPADNASFGWTVTLLVLACIATLFLLVKLVVVDFPQDHYIYLARSMAQGSLNVDNMPLVHPDFIEWQGHRYLPFGPLPAVLLVPFLPLLNLGLQLGWISILFSLLNIWLLYRILGLVHVDDERRRWAMLLFFAGTDYFAAVLVPFSTWFAHVVVVTFVLLAIHETLTGKRAWLVGLFFGLAGMTRLSSLFGVVFLVWLILREPLPIPGSAVLRARLLRLAQLGLGLAGPIALLLLYNYARFGSLFESGYGLAILVNPPLQEARAQGLFSLVHIPKNLFTLLLQGPVAYPSIDAPVLEFPYFQISPWGMGLFILSPALVLAFRATIKNTFNQACWIAIAVTLVPLITYYGIGIEQLGYRYALDFLPFLLLLAAIGATTVSLKTMRVLVLISVLINLWGSIWIVGWK